MTGFNLPPGCSVRDLPGCSAADEAAEAMYDAIYDVLGRAEIDVDNMGERGEKLADDIAKLIESAWADGYARGMADEAEATRLHMDAPKEEW